jgi:hypothetical protein
MFDINSLLQMLKGGSMSGPDLGAAQLSPGDADASIANAQVGAATPMDPRKKQMMTQMLMQGGKQMLGGASPQQVQGPSQGAAPPPMPSTAPAAPTQSAGGQNEFLQAMLRKYLQGQG